MLELIAMHCAQRSGGSKQRIRERKSSVLRHARTTLSTALVMKTAERVTAYMRGADVLGRTVAPVDFTQPKQGSVVDASEFYYRMYITAAQRSRGCRLPMVKIPTTVKMSPYYLLLSL